MPEIPKTTLGTILVVDDNAVILKMTSAILDEANFQVLTAKSGPEGIALAEKTAGEIDILLCDLNMPIMRGPQLAAVLKVTRPQIRVVLMSGIGEDGKRLIPKYGCAYIEKPFNPSQLVDCVTSLLRPAERRLSPQITPDFDDGSYCDNPAK